MSILSIFAPNLTLKENYQKQQSDLCQQRKKNKIMSKATRFRSLIQRRKSDKKKLNTTRRSDTQNRPTTPYLPLWAIIGYSLWLCGKRDVLQNDSHKKERIFWEKGSRLRRQTISNRIITNQFSKWTEDKENLSWRGKKNFYFILLFLFASIVSAL